MAARREKGLCFNCDEKFVPGHRCKPPLFLCLLATGGDDPCTLDSAPSVDIPEPTQPTDIEPVLPEPEELSAISLHASEGRFVPTKLRLEGTIAGQSVVVLVENGSTHNFIQTRMANHLGLTIQPSPHLNVTVGNGDSLQCIGRCSQIPLSLGQTQFKVDLYLLPIYGANLVLGVQWLAELGEVFFDYRNL